MLRRLLALFVLCLASAPARAAVATATATSTGSATAAPAPATATAAAGRVIVLGFDGADGRTVAELMDQGQLPNLARLREQGTFAPLRSAAPPESPVAWAALNSGQNPAKTGVASFFVRKIDARAGAVRPTFGHLIDQTGSDAPLLESFPGAPVPAFVLGWSRATLAVVAALSVLAGFLLTFLVLLRMRALPSIVLAVLMAGAAGWGAWAARGYLPQRLPRYGNPMMARTFWDEAARAGKRSVVLDAAQAFDEKPARGARVLWGLGVPDAKGGLGDWCVYTTRESEIARAPEGRATGTAGKVFRVDERAGEIHTQLYGPVNFWLRDELERPLAAIDEQLNSGRIGFKQSQQLAAQKSALLKEQQEAREALPYGVPIPLVVKRDGQRAQIALGSESKTLAEGQWSDFYHLRFELNPMLSVRAITRVKLVKAQDPFELFVDVLHIDPDAPPFWQAISAPFGFSNQLSRASGAFETYGWACATMPLKDGEIGPETFLEDIEFTLGWREKQTLTQLELGGFELLMSVLSEADRVQHMLYQYYDPQHPLYDAAAAARRVRFCGKEIALSEAIPEIYRQVDRVVGEVERRLQPSDVLLIVSDHGFQSFRRQVHVNNWLLERGYLALKPGITLTRANAAQLESYVDWSRTKAYAMSLGFVYLNLRGREPRGIVEPADAPALIDEIGAAMLATRDPSSGAAICSAVYPTAKLHSGAYLDREADLILGFAPPYHVSWATGLGGMGVAEGGEGPGPIFEDNRSPWSGDHTSMDLEAVRGIFFSNRKLALPAEGPDLLHVAPTVLALLGVPRPAELDREPLALR